MKVLLVEDDVQYISSINSELITLYAGLEFYIAKSKDSAERMIIESFYDLIILDLRIPTVDSALDAEPEHGHAVFEFARLTCPGTPLFVLTGSAAEPFMDKLQTNINQVDIWGSGHMPTVKFLAKHKFGSNFITMISPYIEGYATIHDVELQGHDDRFSIKDIRALRIFSSKNRAVKCVVKILSGGLSGAKVIRLNLTDAYGVPILDAVAKIGNKDDVFSENSRFDTNVVRLEGKATPRKLGLVEYGAGNIFGIFYSLAAGYESNAFEIALLNDSVSENLVAEIGKLTNPWRNGLPEKRQEIRAMRQHAIKDEIFDGLRADIPFGWIEELEARTLQTKFGCCHGDLHGLNVLASKEGLPILIDYGDVGNASASWDPITLELSLFFHPNGPLRASSWPTREQAKHWGNLDLYLVDCPYPRFIAACRSLSISCAAGNREIAGCAYSYLVRQLKYDNDRNKIFALLEGAKALFDHG